MRVLDRNGTKQYLRNNLIIDINKIDEIMSGFDFNKIVYEQLIEPGNTIYQFARNPTAFDSCPATGNWFCLPGATLNGIAIIGGVGGRKPKKFTVVAPIVALEGTASPQAVNWFWGGGGAGGHTQIFIPSQLVMHALKPEGEYKSDDLHTA